MQQTEWPKHVCFDCHTAINTEGRHACTTGYAGLYDVAGAKVCYECALIRDLAQAEDTGKLFAYMGRGEQPEGTGLPDPSRRSWIISTWPGLKIATIRVNNTWRIWHRWHRRTSDKGYSFRFTLAGQRWWGIGYGEGMYCHCYRNKRQVKGGR